MKILSRCRWSALAVVAVFGALTTPAWPEPASQFTNIGSIRNTRHNLTQGTLPASTRNIMDSARNDYGEVCVYCHTPHGSQALAQMPLWNRTVKATTYTIYNSKSLTQTVSQPGNNSLTCLTCHDGQTAIDSIINMPGSGGYLASQTTTQNTAFLDTWNNPGGRTDTINHRGLASNNNAQSSTFGCMLCHNDVSGTISDFKIFWIGTDLTNDHPVGITYPAASGVGADFKLPASASGTSRYFDVNIDGRMDNNEVRLYNTGGAVKVECASCHDPHGVPDPANGNKFKPTFLRVANNGAVGSALCLTCHNK